MTLKAIKDCLYLGSQSSARRRLLEHAKINYQVINHSSNEELAFMPATFQEHVMAIAKDKMKTLILPDLIHFNADHLYALTADTLVKNTLTGEVFGKPINHENAISMLASERNAPVEVLTGCCLHKFQHNKLHWNLVDSAYWVSGATIEFYVDIDCIDQYFSTFPYALHCAGAGVIEDHGLSYLKCISGSYTAVLGLPLFELRAALKKMAFQF